MKNMKYFLILLMTCILLSCCNEQPNTYNSSKKKKSEPKNITKVVKNNSGIRAVGRYDFKEAGMRYVLYREVDGGLFIINMTKDSLEVDHLRNLKIR